MGMRGGSGRGETVTHAVFCIVGARRLVEEVAAELANVLHNGAPVGADVRPEGGRGKPAAEHHRGAGQHHHAHAAKAAGRVVQREHAVDAVVVPDAEHGHKHFGHGEEAEVGDGGGFGQPRGARRVHEQRLVQGLHAFPRRARDRPVGR